MGWKAIHFAAAVCSTACHAFVTMLPDHQTSHIQPAFLHYPAVANSMT